MRMWKMQNNEKFKFSRTEMLSQQESAARTRKYVNVLNAVMNDVYCSGTEINFTNIVLNLQYTTVNRVW
jgi:hypothetical protein